MRERQWLIRVAIADKPGALASLATTLSVHDVNLVRIDVVSRTDVAIDDLWIELPPGGRIESLEPVLRRLPGVTLRALTAGSTADDPVVTMAAACTGLAEATDLDGALSSVIDGVCMLGRTTHAAIVRPANDGSLAILRSSFEADTTVAPHEPSIARDAMREGRALSVPGAYPWAPLTWATTLGTTGDAGICAIPLGDERGVYACVIAVREGMPLEAGELARLTGFASAATAVLRRLGFREPMLQPALAEAVPT